MSGKKQNAFPASVGALEVLKAVINDDAGNIFASVAREETDFGQLAAKGDKFAAQQAATLTLGHFREGESQIAQADATQTSVCGADSQSE
jgi:hypothetical protein